MAVSVFASKSQSDSNSESVLESQSQSGLAQVGAQFVKISHHFMPPAKAQVAPASRPPPPPPPFPSCPCCLPWATRPPPLKICSVLDFHFTVYAICWLTRCLSAATCCCCCSSKQQAACFHGVSTRSLWPAALSCSFHLQLLCPSSPACFVPLPISFGTITTAFYASPGVSVLRLIRL